MRLLSVDQVTAYIAELFASDPVLEDVWIQGEISQFTEARSGHCYFSMTDGEATLRCVLFRGQRFAVKQLPAVGDSIAAHGRVGVYQQRGEYQLYVDAILDQGLGILQLEFERLRARLEAEGLFQQERKRPLPTYPRVVGVVTSQSGAVWHDIQDVIGRRFPLVELVLAPANVQGQTAAEELVAALESLWHTGGCDVIIVARGGGSPEDLAPFNDERVARAIFSSPIPIVSAVGHETDVTIADYVADRRAATPSVAAEMVVPDHHAIRSSLSAAIERQRSVIRDRRDQLGDRLTVRRYRLDRLSPQATIDSCRLQLDDRFERSRRAVDVIIRAKRDEIRHGSERIHLLDPRTILDRGFLLTQSEDGSRRITTAAQARRERLLSMVYRDDAVRVRVEEDQS